MALQYQGDGIKLDKYQGGFVLNHYWTVQLNFAADNTGELVFTLKNNANRQVAHLTPTITQHISDIIDSSGITTIPSARDKVSDMGFGAPLVHVNFHGKYFYHTEPEGTYTSAATPTEAQQEIFVNFCNQILAVCHDLIPNVPIDIYQMF